MIVDNNTQNNQVTYSHYFFVAKNNLFNAVKSFFSFMGNAASKIISVNYCPQPVCDVFSAFREKLHAFKEAVVARCSREPSKSETSEQTDSSGKSTSSQDDNDGEFQERNFYHEKRTRATQFRRRLSSVLNFDIKTLDAAVEVYEAIDNLKDGVKSTNKKSLKLNLANKLINLSQLNVDTSSWEELIKMLRSEDIWAITNIINGKKNNIAIELGNAHSPWEKSPQILLHLVLEYTLEALCYDKKASETTPAEKDEAEFYKNTAKAYRDAITKIKEDNFAARSEIVNQINNTNKELRIFIDVPQNVRYTAPKKIIEDGFATSNL